MGSPAWLALTTQLPAAAKVRVVPLTLHTLLLAPASKTTVPPKAEAVNVSGVPTVPVVGGDDQVIVCAALDTVTVVDTGVAGA